MTRGKLSQSAHPSPSGAWSLCLAMAIVAVLRGRVDACSCGNDYETPADELEARDVVFSGVVRELHEGTDEFDAQDLRFHVSASWKGAMSYRIWVHTPALDAGCGYRFSLCSKDLVYGDWQEDGTVLTHICSGTRRIEHDTEAIDELGRPIYLSPGGSQVQCGLVYEVLGTWEIASSSVSGLGAWDLLEFRADGSGTGNWMQDGSLSASANFSFRKVSSVTRDDQSWSRIATSPHRYSTWDRAASKWVHQGEMTIDGTYLVSADGGELIFFDSGNPVLWYRSSSRQVIEPDEDLNPTAEQRDSWGGVKRSATPPDGRCQCGRAAD